MATTAFLGVVAFMIWFGFALTVVVRHLDLLSRADYGLVRRAIHKNNFHAAQVVQAGCAVPRFG